ncbi:hypothetical protein GWK47_011722 [Chionoecetes opilio]|uniref:Uncharacterized protein n=1 Tax=Chionoecetes opilio TaxID=41210 RepID=A0A8J4XXR1_CHIOP|nr:hypothetical protein GWK47_011722 [Chionoecetes opilio]
MNFLMATAIYPFFKLPMVRLLIPEKMDVVKSSLLFEVTEQAVLDTSEGNSLDEDEENDFFKRLESHHQDLQRLSKVYCIIGKNKISDLGVADGCSTITLIYNLVQYPVHTSVEK